MSIVIAVLIFSLLIVIHELGHFFAARKSGIRANEFWLGMGPVLLKKTFFKTETDPGTVFSLRLFPIGGAVVMEGEDGEDSAPNSFQKASIGKRAFTISAGPLMNLVLGLFIVFVLLLPVTYQDTTVLADFPEGFAAVGEAKLMPGDKILRINGYRTYLSSDVSYALTRGGGTYDFVLLRDGETIERPGLSIVPKSYDGSSSLRYGLNFARLEATPLTRVRDSFYTSLGFGRMVFGSLADLIRGEVSVKQLSGPVGVSVVLGEAARTSAYGLWMLVAFISINLGIMNILPIPALDGGRLVFILAEGIRRKPVSPKVESGIHAAGMALLMLLMVYVTIQDIVRVVSG